MIHNAKQHDERGYKVDKGQLLRSCKRQFVDVVASAAGLDKALAPANELFNALEASGHRVLERLQVARETISTHNPLEFFKSWEASKERYVPLSEKPHP